MKITEKKLRVELWLAIGLAVFGCSLLGTGLLLEPIGEINSSVLVAFGEISTLIAAILGVDYHKNKVIQSIKSQSE